MLRTYALSHDAGGEIEGLLMAYNKVLNDMLADIWSAIEWRTRPVKGKRQVRRIPYLRKDGEFRRELRNTTSTWRDGSTRRTGWTRSSGSRSP
jgi:hypothetical protein